MNVYHVKALMKRAAVLSPVLLTVLGADVSAGRPDKPEAEKKILFTDIAKRPSSGINYRRTASDNDALWENLRSKPSVTFFDFGSGAPVMSRGKPGVAVFDYDRDGDLDVYVTNGPGSPNSLYASQLAQGKGLKFIDKAVGAGVDATEFDGTGVCYGDTDNDGDHDLYVLSAGDLNRLYVNNGNGTFTDVTSRSEVGGRRSYSTSCSMGDVNADGLLDIVVANTTQSWDNPLSPTDHNLLLLNRGKNRFEDRSEESGVTRLAGFPPEQAGAAGLTWAIAMVDYDLDSDIDIVTGDDQSAYPIGGAGVPGFVHVLQNDGDGNFTDVSVEAGTNLNGAWMGFAFGDINSDGQLDMFVTNIGDYMNAEYFPYSIGNLSTRWFLGQPDKSFSKQEITPTTATAFGWGTVMSDYDNDGDSDIVYHGGMDGGVLVDVGNPGIILANDGAGNMTADKLALAGSGHARRNVEGVAQGDLNNDGFADLVSVSSFDVPAAVPLSRYSAQWGSELDDLAYFVPAFTPIGPGQFTWAGYQFDDGSLSIDINSASNRNGSTAVNLLGTVGLLHGGRSNRDGIGATVTFTPSRGKTAMHPVIAGDSYASQSELTARFGLGKAADGVVDVLWPGGTRNRLYGAKKGERILFPEIPCSYAGDWRRMRDYRECVDRALQKLARKGLLSKHMQHRFYQSALRAYSSKHRGFEHRHGGDE